MTARSATASDPRAREPSARTKRTNEGSNDEQRHLSRILRFDAAANVLAGLVLLATAALGVAVAHPTAAETWARWALVAVADISAVFGIAKILGLRDVVGVRARRDIGALRDRGGTP